MPKVKLSSRGFTLIEIMVVVVIISSIFVVLGTSYVSVQRTTRDAQRQTDLRTIQSVLQRYYADQHYYPRTINFSLPFSFGPTVYIDRLPVNPAGTADYCYTGERSASEAVCDNAIPTQRCGYYRLYAQLEETAETFSCGGVNTYSVEVTPDRF